MNQIVTHAACMAAGLRDGLRTTQFYARDMTAADGGKASPDSKPTWLSRAVAELARIVDSTLSQAANISLRALSPKWRDLPSPFDLAMRERLAMGLTNTQATLSSEFTLYFFRAARLGLEQWAEKPHLVLEHRIEAVRRNFQPRADDFKEPAPHVLAQLLIALVQARPIARAGALKARVDFLKGVDPNVAVFSSACLALLLAQKGKPRFEIDDVEFLNIVTQLIHTRLHDIAGMVSAKDSQAIARIFADCMSDY